MGDDPAAARLLAELDPYITDPRVRWALSTVPRLAFVPASQRSAAWENRPLPIGKNQTISQPLVVARMLDLLRVQPTDNVLDVGTGSGWHAALLAVLGRHVWTIERHEELATAAARRLGLQGIANVSIFVGDGNYGLPASAPYDVINVAAAARDGVPEALVDQLAVGGRLVVPVGAGGQRLMYLTRRDDGRIVEERLEQVRFVPLVRGPS